MIRPVVRRLVGRRRPRRRIRVPGGRPAGGASAREGRQRQSRLKPAGAKAQPVDEAYRPRSRNTRPTRA